MIRIRFGLMGIWGLHPSSRLLSMTPSSRGCVCSPASQMKVAPAALDKMFYGLLDAAISLDFGWDCFCRNSAIPIQTVAGIISRWRTSPIHGYKRMESSMLATPPATNSQPANGFYSGYPAAGNNAKIGLPLRRFNKGFCRCNNLAKSSIKDLTTSDPLSPARRVLPCFQPGYG